MFGAKRDRVGAGVIGIVSSVEQATSRGFAPTEAVDPTDHVISLLSFLLEDAELSVPVGDRNREDSEIAAGDSLHFELNPEDDSEESGSGDHLVEERVFGGESLLISVGEEDFDFGDVVADGAGFECIFSVEIHSKGTTESGEHCSANNGGPEPGFEGVTPKLFESDSGFTVDQAGCWVKVKDAVEACDVEKD